MSVFSNPKTLYVVRLVQLFFSIGFLVIVSWSGVHRGWWKWWGGLNGALALGVISVLFTLGVTLHGIVTKHIKSNPFSGGSTMRTVLRLALETIIFLLWIGSATLCLRYPKNCFFVDGRCYKPDVDGVQQGILPGDQPQTPWYVGIAFSFVEIVTFALSGFLVFKDERSSKGSAGVSYA